MTALATDSGRKTPARLAGSAILALQSDDRLVKLARSGHERAFEAIVDRYRRPLVRFCGRILPESRCEDAVQQAFINAHAALAASDEPVQLKPWLFAITRNAALNMLRQNGWNYEQIPADFDGVLRPDQVVEQRFELEQTVAAVGDLPERQRDALVMRELEGRSYDEIATALGTGGGAVRQLLNRARVTLRGAASMLVPPPLVARAAASMPPADGRRLGEVLAGVGAAGMAKAGATALVAGTLVVGAVEAPFPAGTHRVPTRQKATLDVDRPARATSKATSVAAKLTAPAPTSHTVKTPAVAPPSHRSGQSGSDTSHSGSSGESGRSGSDDGTRHHSGDTRERSGSDDVRHATDDSPTSGSGGSDDHSGSGQSGSGSDDTVATVSEPEPEPEHVSDSSGSGSGEMPSPEDSSSSGSSGSGSDDVSHTLEP
jgi:RNA polymerase sigma factor (sigma-70 family)